MLHQRQTILSVLAVATLLLVACTPQIVTVQVTVPPETVVVTTTPTRSPRPTPPGPKTVTICVVGEPDTLYLYGDSQIEATQHVLEALYDGPIDYRDYVYHPVILQRLPSLENGDAIIRTASVRTGSTVVNAAGEVVSLAEGMLVHPAGCRTEECAVEFDGETLQMDKMEVRFLLREDVTWSDGEPLTADDSAFAFEVASDAATPARRYLVERTSQYYAQGDWRVKWIGLPGFIPSTYFMNFFAPLPRHQLDGRSPASLLQAEETRRTPLGWGPFVVDEWVTGEYIALSRNPHYFRTSDGLPYLDGVLFRFASSGPEMLSYVLSGECDVSTRDTEFESLLPTLAQVEEEGLLRMVTTPSDSWEQIDFGISSVSSYRRPDFFGDVRVRQAVAQCIDRWAIVDEVTYGHSVVPDSYLPPMHSLYAADDLAYWDYDPLTGRARLEEVGWFDEDGDGVREARGVSGIRNGTPFEVTLLVTADSVASTQVAPIVKTNLADCGIRVTVEPTPAWRLFADGPEGPFFGRQFDLVETRRQFNLFPECEYYVSSEIPDKGQWYGKNASGYASEDYDTACQAALQALPGTSEYETYHRQTQTIFSEDLPAIPLFMWLRVALVRPNVLNFTLDATSPSELWNIEILDVKLAE
jgi:peptide/nickel transport system substrate-binding protein